MTWFGLLPDLLPVGSPAPEFTLSDDGGQSITLSTLRGHSVILVFYPGDETPVCTRQLCDLRDHYQEARQAGALIFGINPASAERHQRFRQRYQLPFRLLVDHRQSVARLYHASGLVVRRTVYRIGPDGLIQVARRGRPDPHDLIP